MSSKVNTSGSPENSPEPNAQRQRLIEELNDRFSASGIRKKQVHRRVAGTAWLLWIQLLSGTRRLFDLIFAGVLLLLLAPVLFGLYLMSRKVVRTPRLGRWGIEYDELSFASGPARRLMALFNVLKGDLALIGPRPVSSGDVSAADRLAWRRFNIRPGLICLWWIRQRTNIAYGSESEADAEYVDTQSFWGDMAIGLRAIPAAFYGEGVSAAPDQIDFLGIRIDNLTMDEAVHTILTRAEGPEASQLSFVNADCVNISYRDADYRNILRNSSVVLADGIGVKLAGRILNTNIRQNVNGTDLFPRLCAELEQKQLGLFLLGGKPGVAADVAAWIHKNYPLVRVAGHRHGFFTPEETPDVLAQIRQSGANILLVAFGAPRQEKWIANHLNEVGAKVAMGVGGLFDFYSGRIARAPQWVREIGMEWFYRFMQEPRRMWRRYFVGNAVFLTRVVLSRLRGGEPK